MDSKKLEILMTAVNLGSFSKASEVVGYTQSGLTHLINGLEREIGMGPHSPGPQRHFPDRERRGPPTGHSGLPQRHGEAGKPDRRHHAEKGGDHPCGSLRQPCHALDAGDPVPVPPGVARTPTWICGWWTTNWSPLSCWRKAAPM